MKKGLFVSLEGGEGVGKTTQLEFIRQWLELRDVPLVTTREPGGTELGEQIRSLLLTRGDYEVAADAELLLIFAARVQHVNEVIQPALERGCWVLCDRFTDASYAYQAGGRGLPRGKISKLEHDLLEDFGPHRTFLFDAPVEVGMTRAGKRGELDRFETEELPFFERVRGAYLDLARENPERVVIIRADCALQEVRTQLEPELEAMLEQWQTHN